MNVKMGYPNKNGQRDFTNLKLDEGKTFIENHCTMNLFDSKFDIEEMGKTKNKDRFHMYPHMVNAYYSPLNNEIVSLQVFYNSHFLIKMQIHQKTLAQLVLFRS